MRRYSTELVHLFGIVVDFFLVPFNSINDLIVGKYFVNVTLRYLANELRVLRILLPFLFIIDDCSYYSGSETLSVFFGVCQKRPSDQILGVDGNHLSSLDIWIVVIQQQFIADFVAVEVGANENFISLEVG